MRPTAGASSHQLLATRLWSVVSKHWPAQASPVGLVSISNLALFVLQLAVGNPLGQLPGASEISNESGHHVINYFMVALSVVCFSK